MIFTCPPKNIRSLTFPDIHIQIFHFRFVTQPSGKKTKKKPKWGCHINNSLTQGGNKKNKTKQKKSFLQLHKSTMISPPAVICLLLKLVLKPPSHSYHTWQFVLCSYAVIKRLPFSLTAGWLRRRRHIFQQKVPFCRLRGLMSWGCTYCSGISSEITVALIRVERGRWLTVWMKINTNIISWIVEGFSPLDFFFSFIWFFFVVSQKTFLHFTCMQILGCLNELRWKIYFLWFLPLNRDVPTFDRMFAGTELFIQR